jgi:hypothetical protein
VIPFQGSARSMIWTRLMLSSTGICLNQIHILALKFFFSIAHWCLYCKILLAQPSLRVQELHGTTNNWSSNEEIFCNSFSFIFNYASNQSTTSAVILETKRTHQTVGTQGGLLCWTHHVHSNWHFASCLALPLQHLPTNCEQGSQE